MNIHDRLKQRLELTHHRQAARSIQSAMTTNPPPSPAFAAAAASGQPITMIATAMPTAAAIDAAGGILQTKSPVCSAATAESKKPGFLTNKAAQAKIAELQATIITLESQVAQKGYSTAKPSAPLTARPAGNTNQSLAAAIVDEQEARAKASKIKTRAEFDALSHKDRAAFIKAGGKLTD